MTLDDLGESFPLWVLKCTVLCAVTSFRQPTKPVLLFVNFLKTLDFAVFRHLCQTCMLLASLSVVGMPDFFTAIGCQSHTADFYVNFTDCYQLLYWINLGTFSYGMCERRAFSLRLSLRQLSFSLLFCWLLMNDIVRDRNIVVHTLLMNVVYNSVDFNSFYTLKFYLICQPWVYTDVHNLLRDKECFI